MPVLRQVLAKGASAVAKGNPFNVAVVTVLPTNNRVPSRGLKASATTCHGSPLSDPENKGQRQSGINFDSLGSWNNRLDLSVNVEQSIKHGKLIPELPIESVGAASLLGRRKVNEDRWLVERLGHDCVLFGIFDGHGGSLAADYTQKHLKEHLVYWLERRQSEGLDLEQVLRNAFVELNNMYTKYLYHHHIGDDHALSCGTTGTVCLLHQDYRLVVGHVGDSRAILCRDGKAQRLTVDHCPDNEAELDRIKDRGGRVTWSSIGRPRVNGRLEMTRSIGDVDLKQYGVTAEPDTRTLAVKHARDAFLVLCTDGVHNVLNSQEVVDIICSLPDAQEASKFVTDQALFFGSEDNCSVLVVPFGAWGKFASNKFHFGFSRNVVGGRY